MPPDAKQLTRPAAALGLLVVSTILVSDQRYVRGEAALLGWINDWPRWLGAPLELVMQLGTLSAAIIVASVVAAVTMPKGPMPTLAVVAAATAGWFLDDVLKDLVQRPRPDPVADGVVVRDVTDGWGFPSGHATLAFALAAVLQPLLPRPWRAVAWGLAVAVGLARIYVGVHWPMDVVGGAALGICIGATAAVVVAPSRNRWGARSARRRPG